MVIEISDDQSVVDNNHEKWIAAIRKITSDAGFTSGMISVAVVGDSEIHELNRRHLDHDYPTDVLSFEFERQGDSLEGEIVVSFETAISNSEEFGNSPERELLLYVIHGSLHLVGCDDKMESDQAIMRDRESYYLSEFG